MKYLFICLAFCTLVTSSCNLGKDLLVEGLVPSLVLGELEARIDGRQFTAFLSTASESDPSVSQSQALSVGGFRAIDTDREEGLLLFIANIFSTNPLLEGRYTYAADCFENEEDHCIAASYGIGEETWSIDEDTDNPAASGEIEFERYESAQGPAVRGTFSFTLINDDDERQLLEIKDGKFNVLITD